jgi:hypothetical protein
LCPQPFKLTEAQRRASLIGGRVVHPPTLVTRLDFRNGSGPDCRPGVESGRCIAVRPLEHWPD